MIGTIRLNQQNAELFSELNKELETIQTQVGSGKAELKLSEDLHDISKLSASEEKKSEVEQFVKNAKRARTDLELLDVAFDRLQNLSVRLQELAVESANGIMSAKERERYIVEAEMIKDEFLDVANQNDSFGNALFAGVSGVSTPFQKDLNGTVSYSGSSIARSIKVSQSLATQQNYAGNEVFLNVTSNTGTSHFNLVDDFIESLKVDLTSGASSNLFSGSSSVDIMLPNTGSQADIEFKLSSNGVDQKITATIYGNDYSELVTKINAVTGSTAISAAMESGNRIRLNNSGDSATITSFKFSNFDADTTKIGIIRNTATDTVDEQISDDRLNSGNLRSNITNVFEHFSSKRAEVGASARRAENESAQQDILMMLEEDISDIKDADLAVLLTQLEFLMTNKEAAQATFTRITSKSLFDFWGNYSSCNFYI